MTPYRKTQKQVNDEIWGAFIGLILSIFLGAWFLMLVLGALGFTQIGYWASLGCLCALKFVTGVLRS